MSYFIKVFFVGVLALSLSSVAYSDEYRRGYTRSDGTYVEPHYRSSPDNTNWNNHSTQGNTNPYTNERGSRARDYSPKADHYGGGREIYTGPRGGQYYINDSGNKVYVPKR